MKLLIAATAIFLGISFTSNAQTSSKNSKGSMKKEQKMEMKEHKCTSACKDGQHVYAHGEKGHKCSKDCPKMTSSESMGTKEHVCTEACKDGSHFYAHGEKGHVCGPECKKAKM